MPVCCRGYGVKYGFRRSFQVSWGHEDGWWYWYPAGRQAASGFRSKNNLLLTLMELIKMHSFLVPSYRIFGFCISLSSFEEPLILCMNRSGKMNGRSRAGSLTTTGAGPGVCLSCSRRAMKQAVRPAVTTAGAPAERPGDGESRHSCGVSHGLCVVRWYHDHDKVVAIPGAAKTSCCAVPDDNSSAL